MYPADSIGLFDSGIGGLSVWQEIVRLLPHEHTVYYADTMHCPYGPKTQEEIIERATQVTEWLIGRQVKMVVVACNTATAAAIDHLRSHYTVPFVGMEPAVKPAALLSQSGVVGVLATRGTFKGRLYNETSERFAGHVKIIEQPGDGLVELIETGKIDAPETEALVRQYIGPMLDAGADHIVLGCTHYPFLIPAIRKITNDKVTLLNPAPAIAQRIKSLLEQNGMLNHSGEDARHEFHSNEKPFNL